MVNEGEVDIEKVCPICGGTGQLLPGRLIPSDSGGLIYLGKRKICWGCDRQGMIK